MRWWGVVASAVWVPVEPRMKFAEPLGRPASNTPLADFALVGQKRNFRYALQGVAIRWWVIGHHVGGEVSSSALVNYKFRRNLHTCYEDI
jgi:hypothetical protein